MRMHAHTRGHTHTHTHTHMHTHTSSPVYGVDPIPAPPPCSYLVVALSMALTPYLAMLGGKIGQVLEKSDVKALQPADEDTKVRGL